MVDALKKAGPGFFGLGLLVCSLALTAGAATPQPPSADNHVADPVPSVQTAATAQTQTQNKTQTKPTNKTRKQRPVLRLLTTLGNIDIELYPRKAPATVDHILALVNDKFYDGLIFHRVIANFMIQTGGYEADMTYREPPTSVVNESFNGWSNRKGFVAMARLEDPDSADTQFFINVNDNDHLDAQPGLPGYTVFGRVIAGWKVVDQIELADTGIRAGLPGVPLEPVIIKTIEQIR